MVQESRLTNATVATKFSRPKTVSIGGDALVVSFKEGEAVAIENLNDV